MAIQYKTDDLLPATEFTIARSGGEALGFDTADVDSVTIIARKAGDAPLFQVAASSWEMNAEGTAITGTYLPAEGHTAVAGNYRLEVRLVVAGKPITFPNGSHGNMSVLENLYDAA